MKPDVLVVGAGPVGLTLAAELSRYGVPVRIIDKIAARTDKSKALAVWSRSLELIDRMGCGASFVNAGLKVRAANIIAGRQLVAHIRVDTVDTPHPYALMLPQSETERLMENHLNSLSVQVERQIECLRFVPNTGSVTAILRHADGHEETLDVPWMMGCDGAHSTVRHGLGMPFEGNTQPSDWILADGSLAGLNTKPDELNLYWHSDGVLAIFPIAPGRYRIIADAGEAKIDGPRPDPTLQEIQAILDQRGPGGLTISSPIWLASFRINERKVADYRAGRVFLLGDAAHIHSPAGGQGMNTGMQDAFNLAWKIALVNHRLAAESLLESYSIERSAVGRQVLTDAGRLTSLAIVRSGVLQSLRNHAASLIFGLSSVRGIMANKLTELSIGYPHSPLTVPAGHGHGGPAPGERAPVSDTGIPIGAGDTPRFALFTQIAPDNSHAALLARYHAILEPQPRPPFSEKAIHLVRPDGYVALVAGPDDWAPVEKYLQRIMGKPA